MLSTGPTDSSDTEGGAEGRVLCLGSEVQDGLHLEDMVGICTIGPMQGSVPWVWLWWRSEVKGGG